MLRGIWSKVEMLKNAEMLAKSPKNRNTHMEITWTWTCSNRRTPACFLLGAIEINGTLVVQWLELVGSSPMHPIPSLPVTFYGGLYISAMDSTCSAHDPRWQVKKKGFSPTFDTHHRYMVAFPYPKPSFKKNSISGTVVYAPVPKMEVYIGPIGILYITALGVLTYSLTRFFTIFCIDMETQRRRSQEFAVSTTLVKSTKHDTSKNGHLHSG